MATQRRLMIAEELWRLPDDGQRHELIAGELTTMPPSDFEHGRLTARLTASLSRHVRIHVLGEVLAAESGFLLARDPDLVRAPGVAYVSRERVAATAEVTGYWPGVPDLAVEVVSLNGLCTEVEEKVAAWLAHGTRLVVVANPRPRTLAVYRSPAQVRHLTVADTLGDEDVVPGWALPAADLFSEDN